MSRFRTIACTMVAALCALGLSVGAALAEGQSAQTRLDKNGRPVPTGVCFLHKVL
ncbi:hypothetical protein [Candidatus Solirubrobacter pratensis]|uniref:hypothetical protein n=1 Tax=Candidatus Solirubrobacter pratensis TaxID=1298857 RepID=UPI00040C7AF0|nr:hypothetical protein [Candidatus Solirubrobacter pratensis]